VKIEDSSNAGGCVGHIAFREIVEWTGRSEGSPTILVDAADQSARAVQMGCACLTTLICEFLHVC
jgi:hypothetical protein